MSEQPEEKPAREQSVTEGQMEFLTPLPDSAIPLTAVEVVEYLDEDGDHAYGFRVQGTQSPSSVAGLLELVKARFLDMANYGCPDD